MRKKSEKLSLHAPLVRSLWENFLTGLLVIGPAFITLAILRLLLGWIFAWATPLAMRITPWATSWWVLWLARILVIIGFILILALIGFATRVLVIKRFFVWLEEFFQKVPMFGKIYGTIRDISNTFKGGKGGLFGRVVLVEWPSKGTYSIGFVTSERETDVEDKMMQKMVNVYIPNTPTPTNGFLVFIAYENVKNVNMTVEEAMKLIISGGVVGPAVPLPNAGRSHA